MGGWSLALAQLGWHVTGVDMDRDACRSHHAAGHATIRADITTLDSARFGAPDVLVGSPPCTDFSRAGKRAGLDGATGHLVWQPLRFIEKLRPRAVALEQVPDVLPIWRQIARRLDDLGYSTWTGILSAEQYGVPQTRQRAYLIARLDGAAVPPEPTHQRYVSGEPARVGDESLFGGGLLPWVSMADALGWGMTDQPGLTYAPGTANGGPDIAGGSGALAVLREAQANGAWRHQDQPAMTITGSADNGNFGWELHTACVEVVRSIDEPAAPGWRGPGDGPRQNAPGSVKLTVEQALTLQGFPPDFPIHGTKTSRFRQIGNAVCPPVAAAILTRLAAHDEAAA